MLYTNTVKQNRAQRLREISIYYISYGYSLPFIHFIRLPTSGYFQRPLILDLKVSNL